MYGKGVPAWMRGYAAGKREEDYEHGFMSRVMTRFDWKCYGWTVQCEQSKNIEWFRINKASGQIFLLVENSTSTV